ncbi:hypothetical protein DY926_12205 [Komagataeibacter melaceti]|uniref:Uncharacterized protein n=1 Tax=Komagataeibacter melaceti TaxID=2766577 RepID=A0A371YYI9_9PROT|nr:hypothetical protein DY926_12205 [Komagataeibacter melaceti]
MKTAELVAAPSSASHTLRSLTMDDEEKRRIIQVPSQGKFMFDRFPELGGSAIKEATTISVPNDVQNHCS